MESDAAKLEDRSQAHGSHVDESPRGGATPEHLSDRSATRLAMQALESIGYLQRSDAGEHAKLFEGMLRYERLTGRNVLSRAVTWDQAAVELVADYYRRECGVADDVDVDRDGRIQIRAYGPIGGFWSTGALSWSVTVPSGANPVGVNATLSNALAQWRAASRGFFTFTQVPAGGNITFAFGGTALDGRFGARGGVAASASFPPSGRVIFDSADFPVSLLQGNSIIPRLLSTALHEIGHALGLSHSSSQTSLMYPFGLNATAIDAESAAAIRALYNWTPVRQFPDARSSLDGPTFATTSSLNFSSAFNRLAMAWRGRGDDSNIWFSSTSDLVTWTPQVPLGDARSTHGPALAAFPSFGPNPRLYLAWKGEGNDNRLFWTRSTDLANFEAHRRFDDRLSTTRPALAEFDNRLVMAWKSSHDEQIYWSKFDGTNWSPQAAIPGRATSHAPALAAFGDRLFMFWKGSGNDTRIFQATLPAGSLGIWSGGEEVSYVRTQVSGMTREIVNTDSHPAAVQRGDSLVLVFRGQPGDSAVWFMPFANGEWSAPFTIRNAGTYTGPGAGVLNGTLLVAWKALDPDHELHFSRLG
jgi:Matrixin